MASMVKRPLFGGAITADTLPELINASDKRQIPDNQEVFLYPESNVSIIVEVLQRVEPSESDEAIKFHFNSLGEDNEATSCQIGRIEHLSKVKVPGDDTPPATFLIGEQRVSKFNLKTQDKVTVFMALYRVESKNIDLVVTFNVPVESADGGAVQPDHLITIEGHFRAFGESLRIVDFSLFA